MGVNSSNKGYIGNNQSDFMSGTLNSRNSYLDIDYQLQNYNEYTRPSEWASLPSMTGGSQMIVFVYGVYNNFSNHLGFYVSTSTGNYNVDWGDGTTGSFSSGSLATKQYTPTTYSGLTTAEFRGYKTLVVRITPATGNLVSWNPYNGNIDYPLTNLRTSRIPPILDVRVAGSSINNIIIRNMGFMEQFEFVGTNSITNMTNFFFSCTALQKIVSLDTSNVTTMISMFQDCRNLRTIPAFNTRSVTNFSTMFYLCYSLINIPLIDTSNATNMSIMFANCQSLTTIPPLNTAKVTNFSNMFTFCYALKKIPLLNTESGTNFQQMFNVCTSLQYIPLFNTSNGTDFYRMFYGSGLRYCPVLNLSKATTVSEMFGATRSLEKVENLNTPLCTNFSNMFYTSALSVAPNLDTSNATTFAGMFVDCPNLQYVPNYNTSKVTNFNFMFGATPIKELTMTIGTTSSISYNTTAFNSMFDRTEIRRVINIDVSGISTGSAFANIYSGMFSSASQTQNNLAEVGVTGIQHNFDVRNAILGPTALNNLYTSLATVGASGSGTKTIVVSGNWGVSAGLGHNPNIAIAKGWTVTT